MIKKLFLHNPDTFGAFASTLCMIHCLATPFIFLTQACSVGGCEATPVWWKSIDYLFLAISFFAIHRSTQTTRKNYMKHALWLNFSILTILIINERIQWLALPQLLMYISAITLAILHLYNLKFCQCKSDKCCAINE